MAKEGQDRRIEVISRTVRQFLAENRMQQREVEAKVGWSQRYLSQLLNGHVRFNFHHLLLIGDALGIEDRELFSRIASNFGEPNSLEGISEPQESEEAADSELDQPETSVGRPKNAEKVDARLGQLASLPVCRALLNHCELIRRDDSSGVYADAAREALTAAEALAPLPLGLHQDMQAEAWAELGNSLRVRGELAAARTAFEAAHRAERRGSGDPSITARILAYRASLARDLGELDDAIDLGLEVIELYETLGEELNAARAQISLASAYGDFLDYRSAFRHLSQALERPALHEDPAMLLIAIHNFAIFVSEAGSTHQALQMAASVAPYYGYFPGGADLKARLIWLQATAQRRLGRSTKAAELFRQASDVFLHLGRDHDAAMATLEAAGALIECGQFTAVGHLAQRATRDLLRLGSTSGALAALTVLKNACEASAVSAELVGKLQRRLEKEHKAPGRLPTPKA